MTDTSALGHLRRDHEDCECAEELDHGLHECDCPGYPITQDPRIPAPSASDSEEG